MIAYAHNGYTDKFGIPRQSREESPIVTRIVFEPEYAVQEALRGIEGFSHLWLIWGFSETPCTVYGVQCTNGIGWGPTVRPPRLGGNKRMGVFATRSPFRPNPIGLSSVRLLKVAYPRPLPEGKGDQLELIVSGADLMDGTPIYDIKPYLSFSDSHEDAQNGFAEDAKDYRLNVVGLPSPPTRSRQAAVTPPLSVLEDIKYILSQDPRPAYQDDPEREYKMDYAGWRVSFTVKDGTVFVRKIVKA